MTDGPWTFDQNLLAMRRLETGDDPATVSLNWSSFWIQVHNLPNGFMSERFAKVVGDSVGFFEATDPRNFEGPRKTFMRVRVRINIERPLRVRMKMKKPGADWFWVDFRYERLPSFCFHCGVIGHGDRFCPVAFEKEEMGKEKPYGPWLRAGGKKVVPPPPMNRWLVMDPEAVEVPPVRREGVPVTVSNNEGLKQHSLLEKGVTPFLNDKVNSSNYVGHKAAINDDNESEGVVIVEQKRKRVGSERDFLVGGETSPMIVEGQLTNVTDEVGPGLQAHPAQ